MANPLRVALLFGGPGREREVSAASAARVLVALRNRGHRVTPIDLSLGALTPRDESRVFGGAKVPEGIPAALAGKGREFEVISDLRPGDFDVVFLALHGSPGEDGTLQATLDLKGMPYTGSSFAACARTFDKHSAKLRLRAAGIDTPPWDLLRRGDALNLKLELPVVVKPRREGSTLGISLVDRSADLERAVAHARDFAEDVLVERFIEGQELTVGVLNGKALTLGEIVLPPKSLFDYARKYQPGRVTEVFPAQIPTELSTRVRATALASHQALELGVYSRVDIRLDSGQRPWVLEVNSLPGLTETSLLPQSAAASGIPFEDMCESIVIQPACTHA